MKFFIVIAFVMIGYLLICNYDLRMKVEYYSEQMNEFHSNLYAQVDGSYKDGAHALSISDIYYRKYFKSSSDDKKD